ncbi:MAG: ABC transporter ATP-binding protein [Amphritea sp.]
MSDIILDVHNLSIDYRTSRGALKALRKVNLQVPKGKIVGIVGESGCGKSTLISAIINLLAPNATVSEGGVKFQDDDLLALTNNQMQHIRGNRFSMIFQDPMTSLNPVISIGTQMVDIQYRDKVSKSAKLDKAAMMLDRVGIPDSQSRLALYPHEFSGGMLQRIAIAMALLVEPDLLIADEPTTALDATLEVQIIHRLKELQASQGCSILFISHHLGVIAELCDEVVVMYAGEVVEQGSVRDIFHRPSHPYTQKLLECDPARIVDKTRDLPTIFGNLPDLVAVPQGCIFADRCEFASSHCHRLRPSRTVVEEGHTANCHLLSKEGVVHA